MAADRQDPRDPLEQLRADRERHRAEERADAGPTAVPPPDWRHDTLELDLDELRHRPEAVGPPPVVGGSVLRSRTHGSGWRAVRRGSGAAVRGARRVRVPTGLVVGLVLLVGAGAASAALGGSADVPRSSPLPTTTTQSGTTETGTDQPRGGTTTAGEQPQGSVRVGTEPGGAAQQPAGPAAAAPAPGSGAPAGPAGPGAPGGEPGGRPGAGPAGGPPSGP